MIKKAELLSEKPRLGEKVHRRQRLWRSRKLSHGRHWRKRRAYDGPSYGRTLYNYFRDYDPTTGRYIQSDPIGLEGGLNTYLYANANPLRFIDPLGLNPGAATRAFQGLAGMLSRMGRPTRPIAPPVIPPGGLPPGYDVPDIPAHTPIDPPMEPMPPIPMPNSGENEGSGEACDEDQDDNCEALYQSILQTCAGLTGRKKFRCFEAARIARDQCYQERKR